MTRFELVYFAAEDVDDGGLDAAGYEALESLQNTRGGKGLRLHNVAKGRRVVGHVQMSDVTSVRVERSQGSTPAPENSNVEVAKTELWKHRISSSKTSAKRGERWGAVTQDLLKLGTKQSQTLYLRFYSDLEEQEQVRDTGIIGQNTSLHKDNALHWAQTIGRVCGRRLNQELPHFGEGSDAELMDYLEIPALPHSSPTLLRETVEI